MRAYFSATLNVDPLAFTHTSSYCSSNIGSISGENKRGNILKFEKKRTTKRKQNKLFLSVFRARERDLENRLVSFHGRFYHKTGYIEPPSVEKLTAMKNLETSRLSPGASRPPGKSTGISYWFPEMYGTVSCITKTIFPVLVIKFTGSVNAPFIQPMFPYGNINFFRVLDCTEDVLHESFS